MRLNKALSFIACLVMLVIALPASSCSSPSSSGTFEKLLSVIPDTPGTREFVAINDYARMRQEFQIAAPAADATVDEEMEYLSTLFKWNNAYERFDVAEFPGFFGAMRYPAFVLQAMHNLGIGYGSIDQEAKAGPQPVTFEIWKGRFDPGKTRQRLTISSKDNPPEIEEYSGNTLYTWGKDYLPDLEKRFAPPAYDHLGRGGRFIVQSNYAFRDTGTPEIKLLVDTQNGKHSSLSDVTEFRLMARELSSLGAVSALLTNQTQSVNNVKRWLIGSSQLGTQEVEKLLGQGPKLLRYQTIALAMAKDEKGLYAVIILVHEDDQTASKNVALLSRRIQETTLLDGSPWTRRISSSSITSRGRVLTAKLYGGGANAWRRLYWEASPLVLHE
ncbi:MAG: hypothetical protein HYX81_04735 [Chloroflexi bacterium]|nr:hypothetical protein [Chloroflexota bacterium]